jgi:medium-chain acyl-[acyl-carrier-protein] hydrolase
LGALLAFEYARASRRSGTGEPRHLFFVAARKAPRLPSEPPIHALPDSEFIRQTSLHYDGIPKVILEDTELLAHFLPIIRGDLKLHASYRYVEDDPLGCPITALGGGTDLLTPRVALEAWATHTDKRFDAHSLPDGHFFIAQARRTVLDTIAHSLL